MTQSHNHAVYLSEVKPERLAWLSRGRLAVGKLTILDGDPGLGKSTLLADWSARVTRGEALPDGEAGAPRGVVLLSAEDGLADTIRPRMEAAGADLNRVLALQAVPDEEEPDGAGRLPIIPDDLYYIEQLVEHAKAALVIVDPLMAYLGADTNAHRDQDVRRALAPLAQLAERTGAAVMLVRHLNKAQSANVLYRGGGSIGIIGAARFGLLVAADPDDADRRILAPTKSNLARQPTALAFRLAPVPDSDVARVEWLGATAHTAAALLYDTRDGEARSERDDAKTWLRDVLSEGPLSATDVLQLADQARIAHRTLKRAKSELGVRSQRSGFGRDGGYRWALGDGADNAPPLIEGHETHRGPQQNGGTPWNGMALHAETGDGSTLDGVRCRACGTIRRRDTRVCHVCHPPAVAS